MFDNQRNYPFIRWKVETGFFTQRSMSKTNELRNKTEDRDEMLFYARPKRMRSKELLKPPFPEQRKKSPGRDEDIVKDEVIEKKVKQEERIFSQVSQKRDKFLFLFTFLLSVLTFLLLIVAALLGYLS